MDTVVSVGRGVLTVIARILSLLLALLIMAAGVALFVGFWFGLNWLLHYLGIPIRILPRL